MAARKITAAIRRRAQRLRAGGTSIREAAERLQVGKTQLAAALAAAPAAEADRAAERTAARSRKPPPAAADEPIDADGPPLDVLRGLLAAQLKRIALLELALPDSPRLNPARQECRKLAGAIDRLDRLERAGTETPEEAEARRRREDGETRKEIRALRVAGRGGGRARWGVRDVRRAARGGRYPGSSMTSPLAVLDLELRPDGSWGLPGVVSAAELEELERMADDGDELRAEARLELFLRGRKKTGPPPGFWHNCARPCGVDGCAGMGGGGGGHWHYFYPGRR